MSTPDPRMAATFNTTQTYYRIRSFQIEVLGSSCVTIVGVPIEIAVLTFVLAFVGGMIPIRSSIKDNEEALRRLTGIAAGILLAASPNARRLVTRAAGPVLTRKAMDAYKDFSDQG